MSIFPDMMAIPWLVVAVLLHITGGTNVSESLESCGSNVSIPMTEEIVIEVKDDATSSPSCMLTFSGEETELCQGLCYQFHPNSFISDSRLLVTIQTTNSTEVFDSSRRIPLPPKCYANPDMTLTYTNSGQYMIQKVEPVFYVSLEIYNRCGPRGSIKNVKFDEVIRFLKGYHQPDEFKSREKSLFTGGILLGFGLSAVFLALFLIGLCYTRRHLYADTKSSVDAHALVEHEDVASPEKTKSSSTSPARLETRTEVAVHSVGPSTTVTSDHDPGLGSNVTDHVTNGLDKRSDKSAPRSINGDRSLTERM